MRWRRCWTSRLFWANFGNSIDESVEEVTRDEGHGCDSEELGGLAIGHDEDV